MANLRTIARVCAAASILCALGYASAYSLRIAWAQQLTDTAPGLREAHRMVPQDARPLKALGSLLIETSATPREGIALLRQALKLNPLDAGVWVQLGLQYEADGDFAEAERCLRRATEADRTFQPQWVLANFCVRRGSSEN